jgi:RNA polymerase sigma factor (sigma-70 family)
MSIENQLYKQLRHLVSTISSCNFIPYDDKKDVVQDVIMILISKIKDGSLSNDFNEIEGYSFMVLRNYCTAWQRKEIKRETPVAEFWEISDNEESELEKIEYREYLHSIAKSYIQQPKYTEVERKILDCLLENKTNKEITDEVSITPDELKKYKFRIKVKMKYDFLRPVKFYVKSMNDKNFLLPCFTAMDVKKFFSSMPQRTVTHFIYSGYVTKEGYYVEKLFKSNKGRKKKENG